MDPRDPEPQLSPGRTPASRQGLLIAAAALSLVAAGSVAALLVRRPVSTPSPPAPPAVTRGSASHAPEPLVQAMSSPPPVPAKMKLDASIATSGGHVGITFDHAVYSPPNARSWIAIAKVGAPDSSYETWTYVEDGTQTAQLNAPVLPGDYEVRLHDDYPHQAFHVVGRLAFKVETGLAEDPNPEPTPSRAGENFTLKAATFHTGDEILVTFPMPLVAKRGEKYWITVAAAGDDDSSYGAWAYVPASATTTSLQAPSTTGKYEVRLHGNYPTKSTNVVARVPFEVD